MKFQFFIIVVQVFISNAFQVELFGDENEQGEKIIVDIINCTNIPEPLIREVTSYISDGHCFRLFEKEDCMGRSIEIPYGSPSLGSLVYWEFNDKAKSVGICRDPCDPEVTGPYPSEYIQILLSTRANYRGNKMILAVDGCNQVPPKFSHSLAVNTFDVCIKMYSEINCYGNSIELRPYTPFHNNLAFWWGQTAVKSVSHCSYGCPHSNIIVNETCDGNLLHGPGDIVLFDEENFKGTWINLNVAQCLNLPGSWKSNGRSLKSFNHTCVMLHNMENCAGASVAVITDDHRKALPDATSKFWTQAQSMQLCPLEKPRISTFSITPNTDGGYHVGYGAIAAIIVIPIGTILVALIVMWLLLKKYRMKPDKLSQKDIQEFIKGLGIALSANNPSANNCNQYAEADTQYLAQNASYNYDYEVPRDKINFETRLPLGEGEFGVVYKGLVLKSQRDPITRESFSVKVVQVAVKTPRGNIRAKGLRSMLKEVKVMIYVGKHPCVVELIGCCTEKLQEGQLFILMEYCANGSLEKFLLNNQANFKNIVHKGKVTIQEDPYTALYLNEHANTAGGSLSFDIFQLVRWCQQISRGMEFLSSKKVLHGDLATRNILIDEYFQCKISDFGMSKNLYTSQEYVRTKTELLPWRTLALESLKSLKFSTESDVWGFGILCWEIFTLGDKPYPGVKWSSDFVRNVEDGLRPSKPTFATSECYTLMLRCWHELPGSRPTFVEISNELEDINSLLISLKHCHQEYTAMHSPVLDPSEETLEIVICT